MIKFFFIEKYSETLHLKKNYTRILSGNNSIYNQFLSVIGSEIKKKNSQIQWNHSKNLWKSSFKPISLRSCICNSK